MSSPVVGPVVGAGRRRLRAVLLGLLVLAAVAVLVRDRRRLGAALGEVPLWLVALSVLPALLAMLASLGVWRSAMGALGAPVPRLLGARIFYASQLGKYLPGSVWSIASQVELTREQQIPRRTVVAVGAVTLAASVAVGLPLAAVLLPWAAPAAAVRFWPVLIAVPLVVAVLHPAVLTPLLDGALRLVRRPPLPVRPSGAGMARAAAWQLLVWLLLGLHAWVLAIAFGAPAARALPLAIGGYALAYPLGLLSLLPGGAGVRDAALTLVLSTVLAPSDALLLALVSRAALVVVDLALAAAAQLIARRSGPPASAPRPPDRSPNAAPPAAGP